MNNRAVHQKYPNLSAKKLRRAFFNRATTTVACDLLGKLLILGNFHGIITETEAYRGMDDEASHAHRGLTQRSGIMFGPPGFSYVYLIYGRYSCFNIVTEAKGQPGAVLIRGLQLITPSHELLDGPGKLCQALGINRLDNGRDLMTDQAFYLCEGMKVSGYQATPRIGISKARDKLWRYILIPA